MFQHFKTVLRALHPAAIANSNRMALDNSQTLAETKRLIESIHSDLKDLRRTVKQLQQQEKSREAQVGSVEERLERMETEQRRTAKQLQEQGKTREAQFGTVEQRLERMAIDQREQSETLRTGLANLAHETAVLRVKESQLRAVTRRDGEMEHKLQELEQIIQDPGAEQHIACAVARATLKTDPFPYVIVDDLLPAPLYDALLAGMPPVELFADRAPNKQQLGVPFRFGPVYARRVWQHMARTVARRYIQPAVLDLFREPFQAFLRDEFREVPPDQLAAMTMTCSDGRILRREAGYYIPPHRDPRWGFITCLMYLARPADDERWGTHIFAVDGDTPIESAAPHWVDADRCRLVETVAFKRNRMLVFLNCVGAHGADIPSDVPPSLDRYVYQFRVGPSKESYPVLLESLPPARRPSWEGKMTDY
jgi:hypothetical protein